MFSLIFSHNIPFMLFLKKKTFKLNLNLVIIHTSGPTIWFLSHTFRTTCWYVQFKCSWNQCTYQHVYVAPWTVDWLPLFIVTDGNRFECAWILSIGWISREKSQSRSKIHLWWISEAQKNGFHGNFVVVVLLLSQ